MLKSAAALVLLAMALPVPAHAADDVSLIGTWSGPRERIAKDGGWRDGLATLVVTEQKGRTFTGYLARANPSGDEKDPLWGAFTPGGRLIAGSDEEGSYAFDLVDKDTLDYCYWETGATARTTCARLTRQK